MPLASTVIDCAVSPVDQRYEAKPGGATSSTEPPSQNVVEPAAVMAGVAGFACSVTVVAAGTGPFTYQWYRGSSPNTSQPVSGATSSSYTTPKLNRGTYTYWVRVTGACGIVNSNTATVIAQ